MAGSGEEGRETIRLEFKRSVMIYFQGCQDRVGHRFSVAAGSRRAFRHLGSNLE